MANIKKNGNLSGAIGNIVFVNGGDRVFVRTKPDRVKQSARTKASAGVFGLVSAREKLFRLRLLRELGIPALQYFAARHRARIRKTVTGDSGIGSDTTPSFGNPQALSGFSFNPKLEWQDCTNFFPTFEMLPSEMKVQLPGLKWKEQITPPKNSSLAVLTLLAVTADLNNASVPVNIISTLEIPINGNSSVPAQEWVFPVEPAGGWLLIVGCIKFTNHNATENTRRQFAAVYLWAGLPEEQPGHQVWV